jgi:hypothetical protein
VSLWLLDNGTETLVVEFDVERMPLTQPRILVDGSIIEVFDGTGTPLTTRAYPTTTSAWLLRLENPTEVSAWMLGP